MAKERKPDDTEIDETASEESSDLDEATGEAGGGGDLEYTEGDGSRDGATGSSDGETDLEYETDNEAGNEADDAGGISEPETDDTAEAGSGQEGGESVGQDAAGAGGNEEGSGKSFNGFYGSIFR